MSKGTKTVIIVVAVAVVLAGAVFGGKALVDYIYSVRNPEVTTEPDTSKELINVNVNKMKKLSVENSYGLFEFQDTDNGWTMTSHDHATDKSIIETYVMLATYIRADKMVAEKVSDKAVYEMNSPIRVTVTTEDSEETILIGGLTPTKETFYIMKEGDEAVYTLGASIYVPDPLSLGSYFAMNVLSLVIDRNYFPDTDYNFLHFERDNEVIIETSKNQDLTWTMTAPINIQTEATSLSVIFVSMKDCQIVQYIGGGQDEETLKQYGLVNPKYVIRFTCDSGTERTVWFGNDSSSSCIYAMDKGTGEVVTLSKSDLEFLDNKAVDLVSYVIYSDSVNDHSKVTATFAGESKVLELTYEGDTVSSLLNGVSVTSTQVSQFYSSLLSALQPDDIETGVTPEGQVALTITFEKKDGTVTEFSFIPKVSPEDGKVYQYYLLENQEYTGILVGFKGVDAVIEAERSSDSK